MKASIDKSEVAGKVSAPSSKSYTIRGLMCAALAKGESKIINPLYSDDTKAAISVLSQIGVSIQDDEECWQVRGGDFHQPAADLFCDNSAATLRFMTAICSLVPGRCRLTTGPSLAKRPIKPLIQALRQLGVSCSSQGEVAPVTVEGGRLKGGTTEMPGDISSQYVSALLFIAPIADEGITVSLSTPLESKPYVLMTTDCLGRFGVKAEYPPQMGRIEISRQAYKPTTYNVEGDWSSASYFLALGALSGEVEVENLNLKSQQGDKVILDFLRDMGASVEVNADSVTVRQSKLNAIHADLSDCIDLLPTVAVLAAAADGTSELNGIERARIKESNRVAAVKDGLERMRIKIEEKRDRLTITGSNPEGAMIDSHDDHRIAMAFGILGTVAGETVINNAECVSKTFPQFWDILKSIGGKVEIDG
jgi:3-phosphoshikimate 1-carboxyvinyltransferase